MKHERLRAVLGAGHEVTCEELRPQAMQAETSARAIGKRVSLPDLLSAVLGDGGMKDLA